VQHLRLSQGANIKTAVFWDEIPHSLVSTFWSNLIPQSSRQKGLKMKAMSSSKALDLSPNNMASHPRKMQYWHYVTYNSSSMDYKTMILQLSQLENIEIYDSECWRGNSYGLF
jgi:hypothetical protein